MVVVGLPVRSRSTSPHGISENTPAPLTCGWFGVPLDPGRTGGASKLGYRWPPITGTMFHKFTNRPSGEMFVICAQSRLVSNVYGVGPSHVGDVAARNGVPGTRG